MRPWIAIGVAAGLVAVAVPLLRQQNPELASLLARGKPAGGATITRQVTPPPLTGVDLTKIEDRGSVATVPAHGSRRAELTVVPKYQRAALGLLRSGLVPEGAILLSDTKTGRVLVWAS